MNSIRTVMKRQKKKEMKARWSRVFENVKNWYRNLNENKNWRNRKSGSKEEEFGGEREREMLGILEFRAGSETKLAQIGLSTRAHWLWIRNYVLPFSLALTPHHHHHPFSLSYLPLLLISLALPLSFSALLFSHWRLDRVLVPVIQLASIRLQCE